MICIITHYFQFLPFSWQKTHLRDSGGSCLDFPEVFQGCAWQLANQTFCRLVAQDKILQAIILEWVAIPFSKGSSQARDRTQVSHIASRFLTNWATREAQEYWSGSPIPSPADLPNPVIEPGSPALQVDSLPTELSGKPCGYHELMNYLLSSAYINAKNLSLALMI